MHAAHELSNKSLHDLTAKRLTLSLVRKCELKTLFSILLLLSANWSKAVQTTAFSNSKIRNAKESRLSHFPLLRVHRIMGARTSPQRMGLGQGHEKTFRHSSLRLLSLGWYLFLSFLFFFVSSIRERTKRTR